MENRDCKLHSAECKCLSWKPIIAGALVAIGLSFLLHLFSVAIGLTAFSKDQGSENLILGGLIATAFGTIVVMFASGWIAGYLGNRSCNKRHLGALYGFLTWVVALIALMLIVDNIMNYINLYSHSISTNSGVPIILNKAVKAQNAMAQQASNATVIVSSYVIFILFFLSAFASSLGGHCGMQYICKAEK
jgi:hypothetical protein